MRFLILVYPIVQTTLFRAHNVDYTLKIHTCLTQCKDPGTSRVSSKQVIQLALTSTMSCSVFITYSHHSCEECGINLPDYYCENAGRAYCFDDYCKQFGYKCEKCQQCIIGPTMVRPSRNWSRIIF